MDHSFTSFEYEKCKIEHKMYNFEYRIYQKRGPMEKFGFHIRNQRPQLSHKYIMVCQSQKISFIVLASVIVSTVKRHSMI